MDDMTADGGKACVCFGGWGGPSADCFERTCDYNCNNRGLCSNGTCFCTAPWTGKHCGETSCNPECENGECRKGECECEDSWWGEACERKECINGEWSDENGGGCKCRLGWAGDDCNTTSLCLPGTCANGGYCGKNQRCVCTHEFTGAKCEQVVCPNDCSGHGECDAEAYRCRCHPGFDGFLCEVEDDSDSADAIMRALRLRAEAAGRDADASLRGVAINSRLRRR